VAVRGCGGRGRYANSIEGRGEFAVCRDCAVERTHDTAGAENWLAGKSSDQAVVEEGREKGSVWQRDGEVVSAPKRVELSCWRVIRGGLLDTIGRCELPHVRTEL
jgi:hypothetical protein